MPIQPDKRGLWYVGTDSGAESEKQRYANARRPECFLSMQRIDGERRIDIAKSTLTGLVNDAPSGDIGFAFRVFGHKEADSCRTDLEMAPTPLDRAAAAARRIRRT